MRKPTYRSTPIWMLISLILLGLALFIAEYLLYSEQWAKHGADADGPTQISITDRHGQILRNIREDRYGPDREAFVHWVGDKQGNVLTWVICGCKTATRNYDPVNGWYSYGSGVTRVRLTLDAGLQQAAYQALEPYSGTVALLNYRTGEILCAVSAPSFDPEAPGEVREGMYLNRFLHGRYTPGSVFKVITTAAALENLDLSDWSYTCRGREECGTERVVCSRSHGPVDLKKAMQESCNCAYAHLAQCLGADTLERYVDACGVCRQVQVDGIITAKGNIELEEVSGTSLAWSAIGQAKDLINPCTFLSYMGAVANDGMGVRPYVIASADGIYEAKTQVTGAVMAADTARTIQSFMRNNVVANYGQEVMCGFRVCAKTGTAEVSGKKPNAVLTGFLTEEEYPYAFFILAENAGSGKKVCLPILSQLLLALKEVPPA